MIPRELSRSALLLVCLLAFVQAWGQTDSLNESLDSTVLAAHRHTSALVLGKAGIEKLDIGALASMPSVLGNSDPMRFLAYLPGVETGGELDGGLHIQGSETAHSIVTMQGVPVYGAAHLLGLFSVFNPPHFESMQFSPRALNANRLGGEVDLRLPSAIPDRVHTDLSLGLISAQGTLRLPLGKKTSLSFSARGSFLDLLYKDYIKVEGEPLSYSFDDINLSLVSRPSERDVLTLNLYKGSDEGSFTSGAAYFDISGNWGNAVVSADWKHGALQQLLWGSQYTFNLQADYNNVKVSVPSSIRSAGYRISWTDDSWDAGAETICHDVLMQYPYLDGITVVGTSEAERQIALESSIWGGWKVQLTPEFSAAVSLRGAHFLDPERLSHWSVSPSATLRYNLLEAGKLELTAGSATQYLFQTGISNFSLPCEFWFLAGKHADPQSSLYSILSYSNSFSSDMYALKADIYYRSLKGQIEYIGDLSDYISGFYNLDKMLLKGDGRNFGISLMLHKQAGRLTGWLAYNLGRSLRRFDVKGYAGEYPSNHERLHELNLVANWNGRNWSAGASIVAASGTPFTAPDSFYLIGNRIVSHFGTHNSSRLAPYFRTDLSFNWYVIRDDSQTFGINVSVYNATMRENQIYCELKVTEDHRFAYVPVGIGFSILPSISIFYRR